MKALAQSLRCLFDDVRVEFEVSAKDMINDALLGSFSVIVLAIDTVIIIAAVRS